MENKTEKDKSEYDDVSFSKRIKLLVDIIGQDVILDIKKKKPKGYKRKLQRIYNGESVQYTNLDTSEYEPESPQFYCKLFFEEIYDNYGVPPLICTSIFSDISDFMHHFSIYTESNKILDKSKNEIVLCALEGLISHHIEGNSDKDVFKTSKKSVLEFLTDSYKIIFNEIFKKFKNKKNFYEEITKDLYKQESHKKNIDNWINEKCNSDWQTLIPILDCLKGKHITFVHRLIGMYLRKNAQKVLADILDISENELKEIIIKIVSLIKKEQSLEKFPSALYFDDIWINDQRFLISMCLQYQNNYKNGSDIAKSNDTIEYLERNYNHSSEEKYLFFWLQTRAKIFVKYCDLEGHREEILDGYRKAFDELYNKQSNPFLAQFLTEIIMINDFFYPRRKNAEKYYKYGYNRGKFGADKQKILNTFKKFKNKDIRKTFVDIHEKICELYISQRVCKIFDENTYEKPNVNFKLLDIFDVVDFRMILE